jgi:hypothetical protein
MAETAITIIDKTYKDNSSLLAYLSDKKEVSLLQLAEESFRRTLVLAAASLFEHEISESIHAYCDRNSASNPCVLALIRIKALKRQYFSYFDWENKSARTFFTLLGDDIGEKLKAEARVEPLRSSVDAFLELGFLRNCLVHQNFASYAFEKTNEEVYALYRSAYGFVNRVRELLA